VVEVGFSTSRAEFVTKCFLAEIGDALLNVQGPRREVFQVSGRAPKIFLAQQRADSNVSGRDTSSVGECRMWISPVSANPDLDEFGRAAFEYARYVWLRCRGPLVQAGESNAASRKNRKAWVGKIPRHRKTQMRENAPRAVRARGSGFRNTVRGYNARAPASRRAPELSRLDMERATGQRSRSIAGSGVSLMPRRRAHH